MYFFYCNSIKVYKWTEKLKEPLENVITLMIKEMSKRCKCIVFILDSFYTRLLHFNWNIRKLVPHFTIRIRENEEFIPPRPKFNRTLTDSKNSACDAYVILVANGYQVNELLQYGESQRLLKTQGTFLLMHDFRLFNVEMKNLWNRLANVIFIRRFSALKMRSGETVHSEWFNLETVNYPISKDGPVKTSYVDTWYKGEFRYKKNYYSKTLNDLQRQKLKVAIFEHIPAVTKYSRKFYKYWRNESNVALGVEFEIMRIISQKLNFKPIFYRPKNVETLKWGISGDNGSYDGLLGEAVAAKASFFLGDFHYTLRHYKLLDLSYPYNTECLTFLTPESLTENSWQLLIVPFQMYSWIAVILILLLAAFAFRLFALFYQNQILPFKQKLEEKHQISVPKQLIKNKLVPVDIQDKKLEGLSLFTEAQNSILYTFSMLLQVSLPRLPEVWALRVFIGWWWLYSILVTVAYRAALTASLAHPVGRVTIDTFAELAKSSISVGGWGEDKKDPFISSSDVDLMKIGDKFSLTNNEDDAIARVANGSFGYYENIYFLQEARAKRQLLEVIENQKTKGTNRGTINDRELHIMKECVIHMPISIGMDKNSPLKPAVDEIVKNVVESGLVKKWLSDVIEWSKIAEIKSESNGPKALVSTKKLYGGIVALAIGYCLGLIAFIAEILHWKYIVMKNPAYDKYQMDVFYRNLKQKM